VRGRRLRIVARQRQARPRATRNQRQGGEAEEASSDQGSASGAPTSPRSVAPSGLEGTSRPPAHAAEGGQTAPGLPREQSKVERRQALRQLHKLLEQGQEGLPEAGHEGGVNSRLRPTQEPAGGLARRASLGPGALREGKSPQGSGSVAAGGRGSGQSPLAVMRKSLSASSATSSSSSSFTSFSSSASASSTAHHVSGAPSLLLGLHGAPSAYGNSSPAVERMQGRAVLAKLDEAAAYNGQALGAAPEGDAWERTQEGAEGTAGQPGLLDEVQTGAAGDDAAERGLGKRDSQGVPVRQLSPLRQHAGGLVGGPASVLGHELGPREPPRQGPCLPRGVPASGAPLRATFISSWRTLGSPSCCPRASPTRAG